MTSLHDQTYHGVTKLVIRKQAHGTSAWIEIRVMDEKERCTSEIAFFGIKNERPEIENMEEE